MKEKEDKEYKEMMEEIRERGKERKIIVSKNKKKRGRYMIVLGNRSESVEREIGIKVREVIKNMDDMENIIRKGKEN